MNPSDTSATRREFLQQAAGLAAGAALLADSARAAEQPAAELLPTIKLGPHAVTRLIIGGNPIYGYSHFNKMLSQHQSAWHTPERVVELLQHAEKIGINTWQNSYAERTLADLERFRAAGPLPCHDRVYPLAQPPIGAPQRYPGTGEASEDSIGPRGVGLPMVLIVIPH